MILELTFSKMALGLMIGIVAFAAGLVVGITITLFQVMLPNWRKRLELLKFIISHRRDIEQIMNEKKD